MATSTSALSLMTEGRELSHQLAKAKREEAMRQLRQSFPSSSSSFPSISVPERDSVDRRLVSAAAERTNTITMDGKQARDVVHILNTIVSGYTCRNKWKQS